GTVNVGALTANDRKAAYSGDTSLVNRWERGSYGITAVNGGYDLNGNGTPDVTREDTSASTGEPRAVAAIRKYQGTSAEPQTKSLPPDAKQRLTPLGSTQEFLPNENTAQQTGRIVREVGTFIETRVLSTMPEGLYRTDDIADALGYSKNG